MRILRIQNLIKGNPWAIPAIFVAFSLILALLVESADKSEPTARENEISGIDTFIPSGFVLVPIEVQNQASLDSLIGRYGVVDLYATGASEPLARGLKIVRSPRDPSQFAVLVPDRNSKTLVRAGEKPLIAVVQNPNSGKAEVQKQPQPLRRIVLEDQK